MTPTSSFTPYRPYQYRREDFTRPETYAQTQLPVDYATTLIPAAYTSADFYALEQEKLFAHSWVAVGLTAQVAKAGDVITVTVAGQSLIIIRDRSGQLRAFYNVCRHRGARLFDQQANAPCNVHVIRCPYHSWGYDLTGACIGTPLFAGSPIPPEQQGAFTMQDVKQFDRADYSLLPVRVEAWGCLLLVNLDGAAPPLLDSLGDLPMRTSGYSLEEWTIQRHKTYHFNANWKLVAENYMEYYHLPWVHPELIKVSRMEDHYRYQGPGMYTGMTTTPVSPNTETGGWLALPPKSGLNAADAVSGRFFWLFPNTSLSILPNHLFVMLCTPDGPGHTIEETYILTHPDAVRDPSAQAELDNLLHFWDTVNQEDIAIVEQVQRGLATSAAYQGGRMCYKFEEPIHRFQNMVIDKMLDRDQIPSGDAEDHLPLFPK